MRIASYLRKFHHLFANANFDDQFANSNLFAIIDCLLAVFIFLFAISSKLFAFPDILFANYKLLVKSHTLLAILASLFAKSTVLFANPAPPLLAPAPPRPAAPHPQKNKTPRNHPNRGMLYLFYFLCQQLCENPIFKIDFQYNKCSLLSKHYLL
ncbi:hypothetical protein SAMN05877842_101175 [Ureibacillus acetophenoni]|uniref:Uncharacterized protein n=1 Tax=Ureibacillus acetophenoni TaxID=614649 RepID=A0A285TZ67_9BACL|nr:hypothetical protein SAMN05877842_101175 [Ureibacillus acetophenoni]